MTIARLIYTSRARPGLDDDAIQDILQEARARNAHEKITGLLIFRGGHFMQLLEGPPDGVGLVFDLIRADPRHEDVAVIYRDAGAARQFPDWSMGFERLDPAPGLAKSHGPAGAGWFELRERDRAPALPPGVDDTVRTLFASFHICLSEPRG